MPETVEAIAPFVAMYRTLAAVNPLWRVDLGTPTGPGWIRGADLRQADAGPFHAFLAELGRKGETSDRRAIAAAFALRFGWSSGAMIAAYVFHAWVPSMALDNASFLFNERTLFERLALHEAAGSVHSPIGRLRDGLIRQAEPVGETLFNWSRLSIKGLWGLIASSWGGQFVTALRLRDNPPASTIEYVRRFFQGDDVIFRMQPTLYPITVRNLTEVHYRAAACCRYYRRPGAHYCAMCPLPSKGERLRQAPVRFRLED